MKPAELEARLAAFIAKQVGVEAVRVEGSKRMAGGASRETWSFDASYLENGSEVRRPLILRRDPGAGSVQTNHREEFLLLQAAHASGVLSRRSAAQRRAGEPRPPHGRDGLELLDLMEGE